MARIVTVSRRCAPGRTPCERSSWRSRARGFLAGARRDAHLDRSLPSYRLLADGLLARRCRTTKGPTREGPSGRYPLRYRFLAALLAVLRHRALLDGTQT